MFSRKGQGTIEYLTIIAVVIVAGLLLVGLLTGFFGSAQNIDEIQTKLYWAAQELAIIDGIADVDGNAIFTIQSNVGENITFDSMTIDGKDFNINSGNGRLLSRGDKYNAHLQGVTVCSNTKQPYLISLHYTSKRGIPQTIKANYYIVTCVPNITIASSEDGGLTLTGEAANGSIYMYDDGWVSSSPTGLMGLVVSNDFLCFDGTNCDSNIGIEDGNLVFSSN